MEKMEITQRLSALAQPTRLDIFLTIAKHDAGLSATQIAEEAGALRTNTSVHLTVLRNAGLLTSTKSGRTVTYKVEREAVRSLARFLSRAAG